MNNNQLPLTPYFDRVFVKRDETIERTKSGVIIPDGDKERPNRGVVLAVGPTCTNFTFVGQHIIFGQHHGFELAIGTEEITVLREQDIYAGDKKPFMMIEGRPATDTEIGQILTQNDNGRHV